MLQILNVAQNTKINLDILQKTKFGRHVNICRKKPGVTQEVQVRSIMCIWPGKLGCTRILDLPLQ